MFGVSQVKLDAFSWFDLWLTRGGSVNDNKLLCETIHHVFPLGPGIPAGKSAAVDSSPSSNVILVSGHTFDGLMVVVLCALSVVGHHMIHDTRSMIQLRAFSVGQVVVGILKILGAHVRRSVVVFALHFLCTR